MTAVEKKVRTIDAFCNAFQDQNISHALLFQDLPDLYGMDRFVLTDVCILLQEYKKELRKNG